MSMLRKYFEEGVWHRFLKWGRYSNILFHDIGKLKPLVDSVYNFDDVPKAYERIMTSRATGKVTVKVDNTIPDIWGAILSNRVTSIYAT